MKFTAEMRSARARKMIEELQKRISDMRPVWKKYIDYWQTDIMPKTWSTKGKIMGESWPALSQKYAAWKKKKSGKRLMEFTSRLFKAVQGGAGWFEKLEKDDLTIGVQGHEYFYHVQERKNKGRFYFHTRDNQMPNRADAFLIKTIDDYLEEADK